MSPEQAAGNQGDCDVKTDVHALGNLLHEVLCGRGVYDVGSLSTAAQLRVVAAGRRDLSAVDDRGRTLPTDLRRIIAMATEPERERRYATAAALAEDIERYRTRRPVIARRAGPWYLARKAAERHPVSAALLVLLTVVIVGSLAVLVNLNAREREAVRVAQAESARSASLARYLTGMMKSPDPMRLGPDVTMVAAFADAAGRAEAELAGDPRTLADVLKTIAAVQMALDNNETALATLVRAEAAKIRDPQHKPVDLLALRMNRIDMLFAMGRDAEADSIVHAIAAAARDRPDMASIEAKARLALSKHQVMMGEFTEADRNASRARELLLSLPDPNRTDLVFTRRLQALCLERHGSRAAAIGLLRRELAECVRDLDLDTPPVLAVKGDLASVLGDDGGEESVRLQQEALASAIKLIGPDHLDVAKYDCHLAYYLARVGRADEALPHAEKASRVWRGRFGRLHPRTAKAEHTLAYVSRARGDLVGAERHAREALLIYAALEIPSLAVFALDTHGELAQALLGQGRLPEAEAAARDGLRDVRDELAGYLGVGRVRCVLGTVLLAAGRSQEAAAEFEAARTVNDAQDPPCRTLAARVDGGLSRARANGGLAGSP